MFSNFHKKGLSNSYSDISASDKNIDKLRDLMNTVEDQAFTKKKKSLAPQKNAKRLNWPKARNSRNFSKYFRHGCI